MDSTQAKGRCRTFTNDESQGQSLIAVSAGKVIRTVLPGRFDDRPAPGCFGCAGRSKRMPAPPPGALDHRPWRRGILDPAGPAHVNWRILWGMAVLHLLAALAFIPWLFSWSGLGCAVVAYYLFGVLGINV